MIDLTGKHIFIAGGSQGIGAAARLAAAGADIAINHLQNESAARGVVGDIEALGRKAVAPPADIAEDRALDRAMDTAVGALGPLHGLVVSAGVSEGAYLQDMTVAFWDRTMAVNVRGTFPAVRAAVRHLRGGARRLNRHLHQHRRPARLRRVFRLCHVQRGANPVHALHGKELALDRIRVNCIAPAWTETEMAAPSLDSLGREEVAPGFSLGRIGLPEDVAGAACFLLSDLAAFITGSTLTVDGGMDMRG